MVCVEDGMSVGMASTAAIALARLEDTVRADEMRSGTRAMLYSSSDRCGPLGPREMETVHSVRDPNFSKHCRYNKSVVKTIHVNSPMRIERNMNRTNRNGRKPEDMLN